MIDIRSQTHVLTLIYWLSYVARLKIYMEVLIRRSLTDSHTGSSPWRARGRKSLQCAQGVKFVKAAVQVHWIEESSCRRSSQLKDFASTRSSQEVAQEIEQSFADRLRGPRGTRFPVQVGKSVASRHGG